MSIVYSYIRFSSKRQEQGDSVRRQLAMAEAWMKRHPEHTLNTTLRLRDLGVRAFNGANLDPSKGDLGKFIALAKQENSPIAPGSILMLENLDRFSRQPTRKAYRVFCELVETGVKVLTLDPEQLIDENNIDNMEVVLPVIIKMQLSHEESRKKSGRIAEQWKARRQRAMKDGTPMTKRCPAWLRWDGKADKWVAKPSAKETLTYIFKRTCEGIGQQRLTAELQSKFKPLGNSKRWNGSMVASILTSRAVLGEITPQSSNGKIPPIIGYYPRMIPDALWYRARAATTGRKKARGRNRLFVNLFVGLVKMADGHQAHIQTSNWTSGTGRHIHRRIVSAGYRDRVKGACPLTLDYWKAEKYILACLYQLNPDHLFKSNGRGDCSIKSKEQELTGVEHRLAELEKALGNSSQPVPQLLTAIGELQTRREALKGQIENLRQREVTATTQPVQKAKGILTTLAKKPTAEQHDLRLKLRGLIADIVEGVEIEPYRTEGRRIEARIKVIWRDNPLGWGVADTGKVSVETIADVARDFLPRLEQRERTTATTKPTTAKPSKRRPVTRTTKRTKRAS